MKYRFLFFALMTGAVVLAGCSLIGGAKPAVVISSPPSGSTYHEGDDVAVQSTSADQAGIVRVELTVDGAVVRNDTAPAPQANYSLIQTWKATPGSHTLIVRAYNAAGVASDPAAVSVQVNPAVAQNVATPTAALAPVIPSITPAPLPPGSPSPTTAAAPGVCTNNAAFVADVSIPDGTVEAAGATFNKTWRLSNTGTCAWGVGYQFVFIGGEAMTGSTAVNVPATASGTTADLLVPMTASTVPGNHSGTWRMRSAGGAIFGQAVSVKITVPGAPPPVPPPSGCSGAAVIASFTAASPTITAGGSTTLNWGAVTNADSVEIDHGIGGVPAPGSTSVSPGSTTTYTMTAHCGANTTTAQVTVTVNPVVLPPPPAPITVVRCSIQSESGEVVKSGVSRSVTQALYAGDDSSNNSYRAFFSFNIGDIAGKTLDVGNLNIGTTNPQGNPFAGLGTLFVGVLDYGTLDISDYDMSGTAIQNITSGPAGQYNIKASIQSAVSASKSRFQLRFHFASETNSNNSADILNWPSNNNVCLTITYH